MLFRRRTQLSEPARAALAAVLRAPTFELIPLRDAIGQARHLPQGSTVSVTASPGKGLDATVELSAALRAAGFRPVPHVAARMVRDRTHLHELLTRLDGAGVERAFVVGGDAKEPGDYADALSLLRAMADAGHRLTEVGIAGYPQGHAFIADDALLDAMRAKVPFATYVTTQLCFDPAAIAQWVAARRADGMTLPVHIGLPGVAEPHRLLAITARIGVADTHRFLTKNTRFVARLLRSGGFYRPDALLEGLGEVVADPGQGIEGLHLYTFNAARATEAWRRSFLARVRGGRDELSRTA
jgi:methylenetetrahydrofolate reductase (NADPH)